MSPGAQVIVVGAGPAGLAAAFRLPEAGYTVRVLEAADRPGCKMASKDRDGFLLDQGAIFLPTTHRHLLGLARDAGLDNETFAGGFTFGLVRDGRIHEYGLAVHTIHPSGVLLNSCSEEIRFGDGI